MGAEQPDTMRQRMGPDLFEEWLVWMTDEGIDRGMADLRLQYLLATLSNTIGGGKVLDKEGKERRGYILSDFPLPWVPEHVREAKRRTRQRERVETPEETRRRVAMVMQAFGARDPKYSVRKPRGTPTNNF